MGRTGVTYFDVSNAAEALRQRGHEPTVDRVREHLGTGSKSTIGPLLKRWREQSGEAADASGLPGDLVNAVRALHERVQQTADERLEQAQAEHQAAVTDLRQQLAQSQASLSQSTTEKEELATQLKELIAENQQLKAEREEMRLSAAKVQSQRDEAWSRIAELKSALDEQKRENRSLRDSYEHYQQKTAEDRQQERDEFRLVTQQHQRQIQQLLEQASKAETRYTELLTEHKAQGETLGNQRTEFHDLQERHAKTKADMESLVLRMKEVIADRDSRQKQMEVAESRAATLSADLAAIRASVHHLQQQLEQTDKALESATDKIDRLQDENRLLGQEKSVLEGRLKQLQQSL